MSRCFIFADHLDSEYGLCLRLSSKAEIEAPLARRPIAEIKVLQLNCNTTVVLPAANACLYLLALPRLNERRARAAIPYALEEELAQSVSALHFAFDNKFYQNNSYIVVVVDKLFLYALLAKIEGLGLDFDEITLDWFALCVGENCISPGGVLLNEHNFIGALNGDLTDYYLLNHESTVNSWLRFNDSLDILPNLKHHSIENNFLLWVAQRLLQNKSINLLQAEFQHKKRQQIVKKWYRVGAVLGMLIFINFLLFKFIYLHAITRDITVLDKKIAIIYREFFPKSPRVMAPKFRVSQLLHESTNNANATVLWRLLDKLAHGLDPRDYIIEKFNFQNQVLSVTLAAQDFAALELLQHRLKRYTIHVVQAQAVSHANKVLATLDLSL